MRIDQAKRLKEIEKNTRLRKLFSDLSLDNVFLKETVRETTSPEKKRRAVEEVMGKLKNIRAKSMSSI